MPISDDQVEKALDFLRDNAEVAAVKRAQRLYVEDYKSVVKARLMQENASQTLGAQEREAYADPRYEAHLQAIREAVEADEAIRFQIAAAEAKIEAWRSQSANNRKGF